MHEEIPPLPPKMRAALIRELDRSGITFAEALDGFDEIPRPEELILLLKTWNDLPAAKRRAWQRAAERENRRVRSLS